MSMITQYADSTYCASHNNKRRRKQLSGLLLVIEHTPNIALPRIITIGMMSKASLIKAKPMERCSSMQLRAAWHRVAICNRPSSQGRQDRRVKLLAADGEGAPPNSMLTVSDPKPDVKPTLEDLPEGALKYVPPTESDKFWTNFKLAFARPWLRFKSESALSFKISGDITEGAKGRFSPDANSLPQICGALAKAAKDPRIVGVCIEVGPLACGWAKVQEIRRYLSYFRQSGKFTIAYMKNGGEKEYYLATACEELILPPSGSLRLTGFVATGTFLRGTLDKLGIEPQVKRIGKFKSAGDQLLRTDMSDAQREQLTAIVEDIHTDFVSTVAEARGKTVEEVEELLQSGIYDTAKFKEGGWVTDLKYEDEIIASLKTRTGGKEDQYRVVGLKKYAAVSPNAFAKRAKKTIAVLRTSGAIVGSSRTGSGTITPDDLIPKLRALASNKKVDAVVLRVDSPGGDALASDLMWREILELRKKKPVIASMGDVAASGGYYLSMAASKIVAEPLTITGSIGVVTGKFNAAEFYEKIGYNKTLVSKGKFSELLADNRPFSEEEQRLFDESADHAYRSFRDKAASSRGMSVDDMQEVAQGRVWSGSRALQSGLVDALGGVHRAVAIAKRAAGIADDEPVRVLSIGRSSTSPLALLLGASAGPSSLSGLLTLLPMLLRGQAPDAAMASLVGLGPLLGLAGSVDAALMEVVRSGSMSYLMTDVDAATVGGLSALGGPAVGGGDSGSFLEEEEGGWGVDSEVWL